jgi:ATP-binding cassette subfamily B protein
LRKNKRLIDNSTKSDIRDLKRLPSPFRSILHYNLPFWKEYLAGGALSATFVLVGLAMPLVIRAVVAGFKNNRMTVFWLGAYFAGLLAVALVTGVARYWERILIIGASRKCEYDLRNDLFHHVQRLSQDFFHRTQTGDIMARATNDLNYVRMFIGPGIMGTIDMMRLPFTLALMIYMSAKLTLLALIPLPLVSLLVYFFVMYMHRQSQRVQDQYSVVTARTQENLAGARVVQAYGIADREIEIFRGESRKYMRENMKLAFVMSFAWPLIGLTIAFMILLVIWQGGRMVIDGALKLEDLTGFVVCMLILIWPLAQFGWILSLYQRGAVGMNRINEILTEVPAIQDNESTDPGFDIAAGEIRFDHVDFRYGETPVLHDVDFVVPPGQTVAIVGPTGSGKSSIVSLLAREYDVTAGRVLVDGLDVRRIPVRALRAAIGYVPQDTFLFSDTIRANVTFGRPDASREDIARACEIAQFTETVDQLPDRYETMLGERGVNLSGGQKQRLAIARAVIRDPKILILDDCLSCVDTHTEEQILQRLKRVMATRTSVIISHRISTIRHADQILVLDEGRMVERGTHDALVRQGGLYAAMYERQLLEEELEKA